MDKNLIAIELSQMETQVTAYENVISKNQAILQSTNFNFYAGQVAFLIGLLGILFLSGVWPLWAFVLAIGVLTYFTAKSKRSAAFHNIAEAQARLEKLKPQIIEKKNELLAHP